MAQFSILQKWFSTSCLPRYRRNATAMTAPLASPSCTLRGLFNSDQFPFASVHPRACSFGPAFGPVVQQCSIISTSLLSGFFLNGSFLSIRALSGGVSIVCGSGPKTGFCRGRFGNVREQTVLTVGDTTFRQCAKECRRATNVRHHQLGAPVLPPGRAMRSPGNEGSQRRRAGLSDHRAEFDENSKSSAVPLTDLEKDKFKEVKIEHTNKLLTLPTTLTLFRVAAVPAILAVFYCKESWATAAGAAIFVLAAVTDWLDGYLARKMGSSSAFGAFLDPVADKLMVAAALVLLCTRPLVNADLASIPWLLPLPTIAIIGREITMSAVREWAATQGGDLHKAVAVNNLGKIKTATQMVAITLLLGSGEGGLDSSLGGILGVSLLYVAAGLALWSLAMYMKGIWGSMFK